MGCLCSIFQSSRGHINHYGNINDLERKLDFDITENVWMETEDTARKLLSPASSSSDTKELIYAYFAGNSLMFGTTKGQQLSSLREKKILSTKVEND